MEAKAFFCWSRSNATVSTESHLKGSSRKDTSESLRLVYFSQR
jgi:hypothetical protein